MNDKRKLFALVLLVLALVSVSLAACIRPGTPVASGGANGGGGVSTGDSNTVHMGLVQFVQTSVTIAKGSKLKLVDDVAVPHIIQNGAWENGTANPSKETGAPTVNASYNGSDQSEVGPFTTAGTFKLYCTIHSGMNLTVTVK